MIERCEQCGGRILWESACNGRWHKRCWEAWKAARDIFLKKAEEAVRAMPIEGSLEELRIRAWDLNKKVEELEEAATLERGCHRCGGDLATGSYRTEVHMVGPCSVGSVLQPILVCGACWKKVWGFLNEDNLTDSRKKDKLPEI